MNIELPQWHSWEFKVCWGYCEGHGVEWQSKRGNIEKVWKKRKENLEENEKEQEW